MAKDKKKEPEQTPETQEQKAEASQPEEAEKKECPPEETELQKLQKEFEEHKQQHLRVLAEYDNFRKRTANEKSAIYNNAVSDTVKELLPIADNIERALGQENASAEDMSIRFRPALKSWASRRWEKWGRLSTPTCTTLWLTSRMSPWERTSSPPCIRKAISWGTGWSATPWSRWPTSSASSTH